MSLNQIIDKLLGRKPTRDTIPAPITYEVGGRLEVIVPTTDSFVSELIQTLNEASDLDLGSIYAGRPLKYETQSGTEFPTYEIFLKDTYNPTGDLYLGQITQSPRSGGGFFMEVINASTPYYPGSLDDAAADTEMALAEQDASDTGRTAGESEDYDALGQQNKEPSKPKAPVYLSDLVTKRMERLGEEADRLNEVPLTHARISFQQIIERVVAMITERYQGTDIYGLMPFKDCVGNVTRYNINVFHVFGGGQMNTGYIAKVDSNPKVVYVGSNDPTMPPNPQLTNIVNQVVGYTSRNRFNDIFKSAADWLSGIKNRLSSPATGTLDS